MSHSTPGKRTKARIKPLIFILPAIVLLVAVVFSMRFFGLLPGQPSTVRSGQEKEHVALARPLGKIKGFEYLRQVNMVGNDFIELKHTATSQRIILLMGKNQSPETYNNLYNQDLSVPMFSLLLGIFKHSTPKFRDQKIEVDHITLDKTGKVTGKTLELEYKTYTITTHIGEKQALFEADLAKVTQASRPVGLVFTFNSKGYTSLDPLEDLIEGLSPPAQPAPAKS
jgi:hypothetical protein